MNEQEARELEARINREAPGLQTDVRHRGYPGYDEPWYIRVSIVRAGVISSLEIEDERQWELFKAIK